MRFQVEITKMVPPGDGFGYYGEKVVFVPETTTGDVVEVTGIKVKKNFIIASLEQVLSPGPDRVEASCPHYDSCGGCSLMHLSYEHQLRLKQEMLKEVFVRQELDMDPDFVPSPSEYQSRFRTKLKCQDRTIGFSDKNSHKITAIPNCKILSSGIMEKLESLAALGRNNCEFSLIQSRARGEIAVSVTEGGKLGPLPGHPTTIVEDYGFGPLELSSRGFAQSNPLITELIIKNLIQRVNGSDEICELYCGCGTFSIPLAKRVERLVGIDINDGSIKTAEENASLNSLDNTEFISANLEKEITLPKCSTFVADPPRKGLSASLLNKIGKSKASRFLYVSCNPATLTRDARALIQTHAFRLTQLTGFDMYCHSTHCEALAIFER
jgi:23S rRNA (uracil1939-C5)-methyltransferase